VDDLEGKSRGMRVRGRGAKSSMAPSNCILESITHLLNPVFSFLFFKKFQRFDDKFRKSHIEEVNRYEIMAYF
jgi:hypothetical protein